MKLNEAIKQMLSEPEEMVLSLPNGINYTIKVFPLTMAEFMHSVAMQPESPFTAAELEEYRATKKVPDKVFSKDSQVKSMLYNTYIIERTLLKNDPEFDVKIIENDVRYYEALLPLCEAVLEITSPPTSLAKKNSLT